MTSASGVANNNGFLLSTRKAGLLFILAMTLGLAWSAASPSQSEAAKVYYCNWTIQTGKWCGGNQGGDTSPVNPPKAAYWLQVGCYPDAPSNDCRASDYSSCYSYGGSQLRIVVQAITNSLQQRYSASGCNLAGWYHPENTVTVLPLMTHLHTYAGYPSYLRVKGWACYGGNPYSLTC